MPELHIQGTAGDVAQAAAEFVAGLAEESQSTQNRFTIALSGASTPLPLYRLLASSPWAGRIAWDRWHIFWGDERCVPPDHQDSNYRMAKEAMLDHIPIPAGQVHRMKGEVGPQEAAEEYETVVRDVFQTPVPSFDLILLGVGDDGHTASLFSGTEALEEKHRLVVANWVPHLDAHRITFTLPLINAARAVAFLDTDGPKADTLRRVLEPSPGEDMPPAAKVRPADGTVHWFLTREAAGRLESLE